LMTEHSPDHTHAVMFIPKEERRAATTTALIWLDPEEAKDCTCTSLKGFAR
jgi:hypothetical protein